MDNAPLGATVTAREVHLRDYWKIVWQSRWTIMAVFFLVVGATAVRTFLQVPLYQATATVEVEAKGRRLAAGTDVSQMGAAGGGWFAEEKYHNTQIEIIKSRDVASRVVDTLDLRAHPDFEEVTDPVGILSKMVLVTPRRDTGLIEVSVRGSDPNEITRRVNAVANSYVARNIEKARGNMRESLDAISQQFEILRSRVGELDQERVGSLTEADIYRPEDQQAIVRQKLVKYESELTDVQIEINQLVQILDQVNRMRRMGGDLLSLPVLAEDLTLRELERNRVDLERDLEIAKVDLRPEHPDYEKTESELAKVQQRIGSQVSLILSKLEIQLGAGQRQEEYLQEKIGDAEDDSRRLVQSSVSHDLKQTETDAKRQIFEGISRAVSEVQIGANLMTNNVSVLDYATPPRFPIKPNKKLNLMIGGFFGLILGLAFAFFLDYLDNTFRSAEDIEKYLGLSVLGVIPKVVDGDIEARAVKEAYQSLRTSVIFSSKNRTLKKVLITSSGPQEGKSSTVASLGRILAQGGERVIVVDCDLRRPTQHVQMKVDREPGMTNYLVAPGDSPDWRLYPQTAGPSNLHVLTCGPIPPSPPQLLGTERFTGLLDTLAENYDWVLLDSPPASSLADSSQLAALADMTILVIRHNRADRDMVAKSLQRVQAVNPVMAGAVLNSVDLDKTYHKDYYYSGYYYLSEDEQLAEKKKRKKSRAENGVNVT